VAGYNPANIAGQVIGYSHHTGKQRLPSTPARQANPSPVKDWTEFARPRLYRAKTPTTHAGWYDGTAIDSIGLSKGFAQPSDKVGKIRQLSHWLTTNKWMAIDAEE
jgi:hypothetical protein